MCFRPAIALLALLIAACRAPGQSSQPINAVPSATAAILYVTPTNAPTLVPTAIQADPTKLPQPTPTPITSPLSSSLDTEPCDQALRRLYTAASDLCLGGASGHFCAGGPPLSVKAESEALNAPGDQAPAIALDSLELAPLLGDSGGLVWLRLDQSLRLNALLIGAIQASDATPQDGSLPPWSSLHIESGPNDSSCEALPARGAIIAHSLYGQTARLAINGVSASIKGAVVVITEALQTKFIALEGQITLLSQGRSTSLTAGEQLDFQYAPGDWGRPAAEPNQPGLLEYDLVKDLPVALFHRPLPIPQPGFVQTQGGVNMRAAPDINARLLFQVPAGQTMNALGISSDGDWLHIRLGNGETGWMSAALLAKTLGEITAVYDETPEPPQRYGELAQRAYVNVAAGGNLREAPDTAFRIRQTLPYGTAVKLLARSPYSPWVKVDAGSVSGWMALFTLRSQAIISSLPIDYTAPLPPRATPTQVFSYGGGHAYPDPDSGY